MKKFETMMIKIIFLMSMCFFSVPLVTHAEDWESITQLPGMNLVGDGYDPPRIPGEYATIFRYRPDVTYDVVGSNSNDIHSYDGGGSYYFNDRNDQTEEKDGQKHYVQLNNIAIYNGEYIDLRINVESLTGPSATRHIQIYTARGGIDFMRMNTRPFNTQAKIRYEFLRHGTEEKIPYQGMWNYRRVNYRKTVDLNPNSIHSMYTNADTELIYDKDYLPLYRIVGESGGENERQTFSILFDAPKGMLNQGIFIKNTGVGYLRYDSSPVTEVELPTPQIVGEVNETYPKVNYKVVQDVPKQEKDTWYPKDYKMFIQLNKGIDIDSIDITATNQDDRNADSYFTYEKDAKNNQIIVSASDATMSNDNFVDNAYFFAISGKIKDRKDYKSLYKDNYYNIPATVFYETQKYNSVSKSSSAKTRAIIEAKAKEQLVATHSNTSDWVNQPIETFFSDMVGAFDTDDLKIKSVEEKTFTTKASGQKVAFVLQGKESGVELAIDVPVKVLDERTVNLNYLDTKGEKIADTVVKKGLEGLEYDFSSENKEIDNYHFLEVDSKYDKETGTFPTTNKELTINFVYELNQQRVTINYKDSDGKLLYKQEEKQLDINKDYNIESRELPGYLIKSVKVNSKEDELTQRNGVTISLSNSPVEIDFIYTPNHFSLLLTSNISDVTQHHDVAYQLSIKSGVEDNSELTSTTYVNTAIQIEIDPKLENIRDIEVLNKRGEIVGNGQYNSETSKIDISLTSDVPNTEDIVVNYLGTVSLDAKTGDTILTNATMSSNYLMYGNSFTIKKEAKELTNKIIGNLGLISAPKEVDFGTFVYEAKDTVIKNPKVDNPLVVMDTRDMSSNTGWTLTAQLIEPLKDSDGVLLDSKLTYLHDNLESELGMDPVEIYKDQSKEQKRVDVTSVWEKNKKYGLQLNINANSSPKPSEYEGKIRWALVAGQP